MKLVVYNVSRTRAIDFISGRNSFYAGDRNLLSNYKLAGFTIRPHRTLARIKKEILLPENSFRIRFGEKTFMVLNSDNSGFHNINFAADYLIVSGNARIDLNVIHQSNPACLIIIDRSNSYSYVRMLKKDCDAWGIVYYDIAEKGAFVFNPN